MISDEFKKEIGQRCKILVHLIIQRGHAKNPTEVGKLIGIQSQAISMMMNGERVMTVEQITNLSKVTNCNPSWLLMGHDPVFLEDQEAEEDIVDFVVRAMNSKQIPIEKAEKIIKAVNRLKEEITQHQATISELNEEIIGLMQVIRKI